MAEKRMTTLKGMTWDHPRGYDPLAACAAHWLAEKGVAIEWERRSLQDFEAYPVQTLARDYDLIVIDHPHVGQITREGCLTSFDGADIDSARSGTVGASYESYHWQGKQWALPIDAATQVMAWRPDLLDEPPVDWEGVMALAGSGRVALALRSPHSLMSLYTLTAQAGSPASIDGPVLFDPEPTARAYRQLAQLARLLDPVCFTQDPIAVFETMARTESKIACAPLIYGYVSYAYAGFRPARLAFSDIPSFAGSGPVGSALGGTGIAVSAFSAHQAEAMAFACWVASGATQRGLFAQSGGQPGHAQAWEDEHVNATTGNFYKATRQTLDHAWVRPRHDGYMAFQHAASERLGAALAADEAPERPIADINRLYRQSVSS